MDPAEFGPWPDFVDYRVSWNVGAAALAKVKIIYYADDTLVVCSGETTTEVE